MAKHHKSATTDLPRPRNSPRTSNKHVYGKSSSNGRKPTKKERTRNHALKQPLNQNTNAPSKKNVRALYQRNGGVAGAASPPGGYNLLPVLSVQGKGKLPVVVSPATCLYYQHHTYGIDRVPSANRNSKKSGTTTRSSSLVRMKTSHFSYVLNNGALCAGVIRTSSRTSGNGRKPGRRLNLDIDDEYYDEYDYTPGIWS